MALSIGNTSAWKTMSNLKVGVSSVWKQATNMWVGVGGAWKAAWSYISAQVIGATYSDGAFSPSTASVLIEFRNTGYMYRSLGGGAAALQYQWATSGNAASEYDIRLTPTGDTLTGSSTSTWLNLASTRSWTLTMTVVGLKSTSCAVEIRDASTLTVLASGTIILEASVEI